MTPEKQIEKVEKLFSMISEEYVKPEELEEILVVLMGTIEKFKSELEQNMAKDKGEMETMHSKMYSELEEMESEVKNKLVKLEGKMEVKLDNTVKQIYSKIKDIESMIPSIPSFEPLERRIDEVESKIPQIPDEITGEKVIEKINSSEDKIDRERVEGLEEEIKKLRDEITTKVNSIPKVGGGRRVPVVKRINLTSQCNGITKSFSLPKDTVEVLGVWGTQFPITFDTADFTLTGNTLTLTDEVSAPETGQTLMALVEVLFY